MEARRAFLLDGSAWLTTEVQPAAENALLLRLGIAGRNRSGLVTCWPGSADVARFERLLVAAGPFWNLGVLLGVCSILAETDTLSGARIFRGSRLHSADRLRVYWVWSLICMIARSGRLYVSQWYLLAFLCFPDFTPANMLLVWRPVQVPRRAIAAWFWGSLIWLWLVPLALAIVYYLVPRIARRPVRAYPSSVLAFWFLIFLGGWTGTRHLIGGPIPAWMVSAGVAAGIMMLFCHHWLNNSALSAVDSRLKVPGFPLLFLGLHVCQGCFSRCHHAFDLGDPTFQTIRSPRVSWCFRLPKRRSSVQSTMPCRASRERIFRGRLAGTSRFPHAPSSNVRWPSEDDTGPPSTTPASVHELG
jgi:hypothetical protein